MIARSVEQIWKLIWGVPATSVGEGTEVDIVRTWSLPVWAALLVLGLVAAYVITIYLLEPGGTRRTLRAVLAATRITLLAIVLLMMYGWMRNQYRTDLPDLVVAVDDSASMSLSDTYAPDEVPSSVRSLVTEKRPTQRIDVVQRLLLHDDAEWLRRLTAGYRVRPYYIGTSARRATDTATQWRERLKELEASGDASRLGRCLQDILLAQRGRPTAAIVVLSDGATTEGETLAEAAASARMRGTPLFLVGIGDAHPRRDVRVADVLVDDVVFLGDLVHFDVMVAGTGFATLPVHVQLRRADDATVLAEQTFNLAGDGQVDRVRLSYRPDTEGELPVIVEILPIDGELNQDNNRQRRSIQVRDETIRVLLVQEYPSYEFRYLKTMLQRSLKRSGGGKAVELTTVLQEADAAYVPQDETAQRAFPVSRDELFAYDVVVFGDVNPAFLSRPVMANLAAFVAERGGGLLVVAGPRHTPQAYRNTSLESLIPCSLDTVMRPDRQHLLQQSLAVRPTRLGLISTEMQIADTPAANAKAWAQLPAIRWLLAAPDLRPAARLLATCTAEFAGQRRAWPVICEQFVGAGRVRLHLTDETYLWGHADGDGEAYERYWLQVIRHLGRSKLLDSNHTVELAIERKRFYRGEPIRLRVRFFDERAAPAADDGVTLIVERVGGRRRPVTLRRDVLRRGVFEATMPRLADGAYRTWISAPILAANPPARSFTVLPPPGERARLEMDAVDLRRAAKVARGKYYSLATADQLLADLPRGRHVRIETLPATPVWNAPLLVALFVILLAGEWLVRRRCGWL